LNGIADLALPASYTVTPLVCELVISQTILDVKKRMAKINLRYMINDYSEAKGEAKWKAKYRGLKDDTILCISHKASTL